MSNPWDLDIAAPTDRDLPPEPPESRSDPYQERIDADAPSAGVHMPTVKPSPEPSTLTPSAGEVYKDLLSIDQVRPTSPSSLPGRLKEQIIAATSASLAAWPEKTLWLAKSALFSVERCEGSFLADRVANETKGFSISAPIAVGQVAHRAIQIGHTHPSANVDELVSAAVAGQCEVDEQFKAFWTAASISAQSDVIAGATSKTTAFFDSWPPLASSWAPRFEDPMVARVGRLTLSVRPDLVLGRPRADLRQTMFLCDFKTSDLKDDHEHEALLYALVSTLRHGVPPYRSCVYSLASGTWVAPEITEQSLTATAQWVSEQACKVVEVLADVRPPVLTVGGYCSWCKAKDTCEAFAASKNPA